MYTVRKQAALIARSLVPSLTKYHRRGESADEETDTLLQAWLSVACWSRWPMSSEVHSLMLSVQLFRCLPRLRPPSTVPWRIVLLRVLCRVTCPNHWSFLLFTVASTGSWGPTRIVIEYLTDSSLWLALISYDNYHKLRYSTVNASIK